MILMYSFHVKTAAVFWLVAVAAGGCTMPLDWPGSSSQANPDGEALIHVATAAEESGNYSTAVDVLRKGVATHPGDVALQTELGNALYMSGNSEEAIKYFQSAIALAPNRQ